MIYLYSLSLSFSVTLAVVTIIIHLLLSFLETTWLSMIFIALTFLSISSYFNILVIIIIIIYFCLKKKKGMKERKQRMEILYNTFSTANVDLYISMKRLSRLDSTSTMVRGCEVAVRFGFQYRSCPKLFQGK